MPDGKPEKYRTPERLRKLIKRNMKRLRYDDWNINHVDETDESELNRVYYITCKDLKKKRNGRR